MTFHEFFCGGGMARAPRRRGQEHRRGSPVQRA